MNPNLNGVQTAQIIRRILIGFLCAGLIIALQGSTSPALAAAGDGQGINGDKQTIAIPSYIYPAGAGLALWEQMTDAAPTVGLVIINPGSGPGAAVDANYAAQLARSQAAGQTVIGYVHSSYGARALADVKADVDAFYTFYPSLDGIFVDEVSTDCTFADKAPGGNGYYSELYDYIQAKSGRSFVVINPGVQTNECYVAVSDVILNFEQTYAVYTDPGYSQPAWVANYPASRFWHLVHTTPSAAEMRNALHLSRQRNAGWVYVTSDVMPNPWDELPAEPYWTGELLGARPAQAVWMYGFDSFDNSQRLGELLSMNINQVFMSVRVPLIDPTATGTYSSTYTSELRDFVSQARGLGISTHAMTLEDPVFTFPAAHAEGIALIENVLNYNVAFPDAAFDGIHIDTEPQALVEWDEIAGESESQKWTRRNGLIEDYVSLLSQIRTTIDASGQSPLFSAAIGWWYNENAASGDLPAGDATALAAYLDILVPMVFFDTPGHTTAQVISRVTDEIAEAPTIVGIHAGEIGSASYVDVQAAIVGLNETFGPNPNYQGTTVFHFGLLDSTRSRLDCAAQTTLAGLNTCIGQGMAGRDSNGYVVPDHLINFGVTPGLAADWRGVVGQMLGGTCAPTASLPPSLSGVYNLRTFTDTDNGKAYCVLMETLDADGNGKVDRGWGTVIVNPTAQRELSVQVSHPKFDAETADQGIGVFRGVDARSFVMAGTHRYANPYCSRVQDFDCEAGRRVIVPASGAADEYLEADVAHNPDSLFQGATQALQSHYDALGPTGNTLLLGEFAALQFHSMAAGSCDAEIYLSYGLGAPAGLPSPGDTLSQLQERLLGIPAAASVQVVGDAPTCSLNGTRNVQGRLLNGVAADSVGATPAATYSGRFIHAEQDPGFRDPQAWIDAITGPRAVMTAPTSADEGALAAFDGSASSGAVSFAWDFGDSNTDTGPTPSHAYADNGIHNVELTVTDAQGASDTATASLTIANVAPVLSAPATLTVDKASPLTINASFTDAGSADTHTATIDWGIGAGAEAASVVETPGAGDISANHTYGNAGTYTATIIVTDDDGESDTATVTVTVRELVDLVFVIDLTGSMWDDIDEVQARASEIVQDLVARNLNFRVAIVGYRDHPIAPYGSPGDFPYLDVLPFASDEPTIIAAIDALTVGGGADWEESVYSGLLRAINTNAGSLGEWRLVAQKRIVLMGDAPPHDPEPVTGYTEQSILDAIDLIEDESGVLGRAGLRAVAVQRPVTIHGIIIGDDPPAHLAFSELAAATGGTSELAAAASNVVGAILATIEKFFTSPPVAVIAPPASVLEGTSILFDGSGSTDPQGGSLTYAWTFGDGSSGSGATPSHSYGDNGVFVVCLTVTNAAPLSNTRCVPITVNNGPPVVEAGPDQVANEGATVALAPATFGDPGTADTHTATIDWGDGSVEPGTVNEIAGSGTVAGAHSYGDNGVYQVTVTVTDDDGASDSDSHTVTVSNVAPTVEAGPDQTVFEDDPVSLSAALFTDPGTLDTHTATIDWGDGTTVSTGGVDEANGSGAVSGSHIYPNPGEYIVLVTVTDDDGDYNSDTLIVTVLHGFLRYGAFAQHNKDGVTLDEGASLLGSLGSNGGIDLKKSSTVTGDVVSGESSVVLGENGQIQGSITAAGKVELKKAARVDANVTSATDIKLKQNATVAGNATAAGTVTLESGAAVGGIILNGAGVLPVPAVTWVALALTSGGPDINVKKGETTTLAPGVYGKLEVKQGATLNLRAGTYAFEKIDIEKAGLVNLDLTDGAILINVVKDVDMKESVQVVVTSAEGSATDILFRVQGGHIKLHKNGRYIGTYLAPDGDIELAEGAFLKGALYGEKVHIKKGATVESDPFALWADLQAAFLAAPPIDVNPSNAFMMYLPTVGSSQ